MIRPLLKPRGPTVKIKRLPERKAVTMCLAAIATDIRQNHVIVTVSDTKLGTGSYSQDVAAAKLKRIHRLWGVMIAGKFSQHGPLLAAIKRRLEKEVRPTLEFVADTCTRVYVEEAKKMAEESVLSKYSLSMAKFIKSRGQIGDSLFERLWGDIERVQVGCDLLMCGFDKDGPHIFSVSNPSMDNPSFITNYDSPGFGAVGTGLYLAESTMYAFGHTVVTPLSLAIYHATVAKYVAESASDVGEFTYLLVFNERGERLKLPTDLPDDLRKRWVLKGKPKVPQDALKMINNALATLNQPVQAKSL